MAENKGALVTKSDVEVQTRQTTSPLPGRIGNVEPKFRPPVPSSGGILSALSSLVLSVARWIDASSGKTDVSSRRNTGQSLERRGNCGRGRGQGRGRCFRN